MPTTTGDHGSGRPLRRSHTALLTTFRRNGDPISTPVSIAHHGGRVYFVSAQASGKAKRLARCPRVRLAPCTVSGNPLGEPISGSARLLEGAERRLARRVLHPTGTLLWSYLLYRVQGHTMNLYEVTLAVSAAGATPCR